MAESLEQLIQDPAWAAKVKGARQQGFSYEEIEARLREKGAFTSATPAPQTAAPSPTPAPTPQAAPGFLEATGQAAMDRVLKPMAESAYNLSPLPAISDIYKTFTGTPEERKALIQQRASEGTLGRMVQPGLDMATVAAPFVAPIATGAGVLATGASRAAGAGPGMADAIGTGVELVGGLGKLARTGSKAGLARQARQDSAALAAGGGTADETGALLKTVTPQRLNKAQKVVGGMFDRVRDGAARTGIVLDPTNPAYASVGDEIAKTQHFLGPNLVGRQAKLLNEVGEKIAAGAPISYKELDDTIRFVNQNIAGGDRDVTKALTFAREQLREAQSAMVQGTPLEHTLALARARWAKEVGPYEKLVSGIKKPETTNVEAFRRTLGKAGDAGRTQKIMRLVGETTGDAQKLRAGFFADLVAKASATTDGAVDAGRLVRSWRGAAPEVRKAMAGSNVVGVDRLFDRLARVGKAAEVRQGVDTLGTVVSLVGGGGYAAVQVANGERDPKKLAIPLALIVGAKGSGRLLSLMARGATTPAGTAAGERVMTLIAAETNRLAGGAE